jgi:hypothetical protein
MRFRSMAIGEVTFHRDGGFTGEVAEKNDFFVGKNRGTRVRVGHMKSFTAKDPEATCRTRQKTGKISLRSPRSTR